MVKNWILLRLVFVLYSITSTVIFFEVNAEENSILGRLKRSSKITEEPSRFRDKRFFYNEAYYDGIRGSDYDDEYINEDEAYYRSVPKLTRDREEDPEAPPELPGDEKSLKRAVYNFAVSLGKIKQAFEDSKDDKVKAVRRSLGRAMVQFRSKKGGNVNMLKRVADIGKTVAESFVKVPRSLITKFKKLKDALVDLVKNVVGKGKKSKDDKETEKGGEEKKDEKEEKKDDKVEKKEEEKKKTRRRG